MEAGGEPEPALPGFAVVEGGQLGGEILVHLLEHFPARGLGCLSVQLLVVVWSGHRCPPG